MSRETAPHHPHLALGPEQEAGAGSRGPVGAGVQRMRTGSGHGVVPASSVGWSPVCTAGTVVHARLLAGKWWGWAGSFLRAMLVKVAAGAPACLHRIRVMEQPGLEGTWQDRWSSFCGRETRRHYRAPWQLGNLPRVTGTIPPHPCVSVIGCSHHKKIYVVPFFLHVILCEESLHPLYSTLVY